LKNKSKLKEKAIAHLKNKRKHVKTIDELVKYYANIPDPEENPFKTISHSLPTLSHSI